MTILFWALLSLAFTVTLLGARRLRGVDTGHILYRFHDVVGVAMIGAMICMMLIQITTA